MKLKVLLVFAFISNENGLLAALYTARTSPLAY